MKQIPHILSYPEKQILSFFWVEWDEGRGFFYCMESKILGNVNGLFQPSEEVFIHQNYQIRKDGNESKD